jgi:hypothetical protein
MGGRDGAISQIAASAITWRAQETTDPIGIARPRQAAEPNHRNHPAIKSQPSMCFAIDEKALEIHDPEAKRAG